MNTMTNDRKLKLEKELKRLSALFIDSIRDKRSLITVSRTSVKDNLKSATIYVTVFPDKFESDALVFLQRHTRDMGQYMADKSKIGRVPSLRVEIDSGEKNR